eukprot:TRINITY_DN38292_c0_g1_i1.p1 TRINITY_DN38292_c0_g1~~TRINITY_DN38292_c0_g1_i1.p1  ORF type:complete len:228 (-),score=31.02 TRINITY_DN38292_c0_g1_i1:53-736(-)
MLPGLAGPSDFCRTQFLARGYPARQQQRRSQVGYVRRLFRLSCISTVLIYSLRTLYLLDNASNTFGSVERSRRCCAHAGTSNCLAFAAPSRPGQPYQRKKRIEKREEYDCPGTKWQGGRRGVQFFVGDLVECQRDGEWVTARVARAPTDEAPGDGTFTVKWDSDAEEMKGVWYKELRKTRNPGKVPMPDWIEDWWPENGPPENPKEMDDDLYWKPGDKTYVRGEGEG